MKTAVSENPKKRLTNLSYDPIPAARYGRNLLELEYKAAETIKIKAHAKEAKYFFQQVLTLLNIGGQDSKVIRLYSNIKVTCFEIKGHWAIPLAGDI